MAYRVPGVVVVPALALYALVTWREHRGRALDSGCNLGSCRVRAFARVRLRGYPIWRVSAARRGEIADRVTSMLRRTAAVFDLELYPFSRERLNERITPLRVSPCWRVLLRSCGVPAEH